MPRRARLVIPCIPWHIIERGNNRSAGFYDTGDYQFYLDTLSEQAVNSDCDIHAFCLMTNHVHLLLTPNVNDSAASLMKQLGQRYAQFINRTYHRSGTLWEGRFRSCLVQNARYTLACYRYIEMNPVRAGIVSHPAEYRWSSYRVNGQGVQRGWLVPHPEYLALGRKVEARIACYRNLFSQDIDPALVAEIRTATNGNYALGNDRFKTEIERMLERRVRPGKAGRPSNA
jgi:putative transposase